MVDRSWPLFHCYLTCRIYLVRSVVNILKLFWSKSRNLKKFVLLPEPAQNAKTKCYTLKLFIIYKNAYFYCSSLGGDIDFLQKLFYYIHYLKSTTYYFRDITLQSESNLINMINCFRTFRVKEWMDARNVIVWLLHSSPKRTFLLSNREPSIEGSTSFSPLTVPHWHFPHWQFPTDTSPPTVPHRHFPTDTSPLTVPPPTFLLLTFPLL